MAYSSAASDALTVIDRRDLRPVFQPIVHLASMAVVGYEALTRGPKGSRVESPLVLLEAARHAGRLAEFDWLCAANAWRAAEAARLHPSISLFLNFEPTTLLAPCPPDVVAMAHRARNRLRVIIEMDENDFLDHPVQALDALDAARGFGWGVAVDSASGRLETMSLLPLIEPDVIKLDQRSATGDRYRMAMLSDIARIYGERTGSRILMQGIEDPEQLGAATVAGAEFAQGFHIGRPGPLSLTRQMPEAIVPLVAEADTDGTTSPFDVIAGEIAPHYAEYQDLESLAAYIAGQAAAADVPGVLLVSVEGRRMPDSGDFAALAEHFAGATFGVLAANHLPIDASRRLRLHKVAPAATDWCVLVLAPHYSGGFVARDLAEPEPQATRRFEYAVTHDPELVGRAARAFLRGLTR